MLRSTIKRCHNVRITEHALHMVSVWSAHFFVLPLRYHRMPRFGYPRWLLYMAIVRSLAIGKARKSAGNITFRTIRGRTIASEKRQKKPVTRVDGKLTKREALFKMASMYIAAHRADINVSFDRSMYGSAGNNFYKVNKAFLAEAFESKVDNVATVTVAELDAAMKSYVGVHANTVYRVKRTGFPVKYLSNAGWLSSDNPTSASGGSSGGSSLG